MPERAGEGVGVGVGVRDGEEEDGEAEEEEEDVSCNSETLLSFASSTSSPRGVALPEPP